MLIDRLELHIRQIGDFGAELEPARSMVSPAAPTRSACHVAFSVMAGEPLTGIGGMQLMPASGEQPKACMN
jgi:hypothetical protein